MLLGTNIGILLGASDFPSSQSLSSNSRFASSAQAIRRYLQRTDTVGLGISDGQLLDLFNSSQNSTQQRRQLRAFLTGAFERTANLTVFVYYVGHGLIDDNNGLVLALNDYSDHTSDGLRISDLSDELKHFRKRGRHILILDCCFAAGALREFQSETVFDIAAQAFGGGLPSRSAKQVAPRWGTALYAASGKDRVAAAPHELNRTMFTDALLEALEHGDPESNSYLTLERVSELVWEHILNRHGPNAVRPELHAPDQTDGNIVSQVALFPNAPLVNTALARANAEVERLREELSHKANETLLLRASVEAAEKRLLQSESERQLHLQAFQEAKRSGEEALAHTAVLKDRLKVTSVKSVVAGEPAEALAELITAVELQRAEIDCVQNSLTDERQNSSAAAEESTRIVVASGQESDNANLSIDKLNIKRELETRIVRSENSVISEQEIGELSAKFLEDYGKIIQSPKPKADKIPHQKARSDQRTVNRRGAILIAVVSCILLFIGILQFMDQVAVKSDPTDKAGPYIPQGYIPSGRSCPYGEIRVRGSCIHNRCIGNRQREECEKGL